MGCTSPDQYRIVVGRVGMVFDGNGKSEANHQLTLFVMQSKDVKCQSVEEPVMLFKLRNRKEVSPASGLPKNRTQARACTPEPFAMSNEVTL
jgi:hypothetical protein